MELLSILERNATSTGGGARLSRASKVSSGAIRNRQFANPHRKAKLFLPFRRCVPMIGLSSEMVIPEALRNEPLSGQDWSPVAGSTGAFVRLWPRSAMKNRVQANLLAASRAPPPHQI